MSRRLALVVMTALSALSAQSGDTLQASWPPPALGTLPLWSPPSGLAIAPPADTLDFPLPVLDADRRVWPTRQRRIGLGMLIVFGALSYHTHQQAEVAYQDYLRSGDITQLDAQFKEAQRLDRLSGWSYLGAEVGLALVVISYIIRP